LRGNLATELHPDGRRHRRGSRLRHHRCGRTVRRTVVRLAPARGAAAIDAASPTPVPMLDIEGRARPQGGGFEAGAYERPGDPIFGYGFGTR
jgi:hypothetical protein